MHQIESSLYTNAFPYLTMEPRADFKITYVNLALLDLLHFKNDKIINLPYSNLKLNKIIDKKSFLALDKSVKNVVSTGKAEKIKLQLLGENFDEKWEIESIPVFDKNQKLKSIRQEFNTLSKNKSPEEKYKELEQKYNSLFENNPDAVFTLDNEGRVTDLNKTALEISGLKKEDVIGQVFSLFLFPEDITRVSKHFHKALKGQTQTFQSRINTHGAKELVVDISSMPLLLDNKIIGVYGIAKDVTQKLKAESLVNENENRFKSLVQEGSDLIAILDEEGFYSYVSPTSESVLGIKPEVFIGQNAFDFIHEEDKVRVKEKLMTISEHPRVTIAPFRFMDSEGKWRWIETIATDLRHDPAIAGIVANSRDVTVQFRKEKEQKIIYEIITNIIEHNDLEVSLGENLKTICAYTGFDIAEAWMLGLDKSSMLRKAEWSRNKDYSKFFSKTVKSFKLGEGLPGKAWESMQIQLWNNLEDNFYFIRKKQAKRAGIKSAIMVPLIFNAEVIAVFSFFYHDSLPEKESYYSLFESISLQLGANLKRKQLDEELNNFFMYSPELIGIAGPDGYFIEVNPAFTKLLGYSKEEILSKPFTEFVHPDDLIDTLKKFQENKKGSRTISFENRYKTKDGKWKWISWHSSDWLESKGGIYAFGSDITELKESNLKMVKFQNIIESSKDAIGLIHLPDNKVSINQAFKDKLGYTEAEIEKIGGPEFIYANQKEAKEVFNAVFNGEFWRGDIKLISKNKKEIDFFLSSGPIKNEKGELIAVYGIHTDITDRKAAEKSIFDAFKEKETILESITDGFFTVDSNWIIKYWNKEAETLLKTKREDVLGKNLWKAFPDAKKLNSYPNYHKVMKTRVPVEFEDYFPPLETWFEAKAYPKADGISVYFKDISNRKKLEEVQKKTMEEIQFAAERQTTILNSLSEHIALLDENGVILQTNESWNNFGETNQLVCSNYCEGVNYHEVSERATGIEEKYGKQASDGILKVLSGKLKFFTMEYPCHSPDELRWFNLNVTPLSSKGKQGAVVSHKNITESKLAESELKKLTQKLKSRAKQLAISNAELEQFAYVASHDLQEPLRMVTSFLTRLEEKYKHELDDKAKQYIFYAVDGAHRMRKVILDLLEYSKINNSKLETDETNVEELLEEICILNRNIIKEKNAMIKWDKMPVIIAAKSPLQQVFQNLISNALKYHKKHEGPVIEIKAEETENHWKFTIHDNGIGISQEYHDKIFIIFQRLHGKSEYGGTGMGLSICKKIIENHKGKIWLESTPEKGTTFYFTIPKNNKAKV
jgi:PAS domain S-box-containing protein